MESGFDCDKRAKQKQLQRDQDIKDLTSKKYSREDLQEKNSIFSGIDWSEVIIFEPNGYSWRMFENRQIGLEKGH